MKTIEATVTSQNLVIAPSVLSVAESVNQYALKITYDDEWTEVDTKIVTFRGADGKAYGIQDNGEEAGVTIPWEVLRCPGKVTVGVVGYVGTVSKIITTGIYDRNTFLVMPAAFGLTEALTPTPDIYQQIVTRLSELQTQIGDLSNLDTTAKNNLVAAINELVHGGGGGTVKSVNNVEPDTDGNVELTSADIGAATAADLADETSAREQADEALQTAIGGKQNALSAAQLAAVNSGIDSTKVTQIATNATAINAVEEKIPAQASASNQLADRAFVNSSVATNTANYISDNGQPFSSLADLEAYSGVLTNNDYAFVVGTDSAGNTTYTRYKYVASAGEWAEEYVLNNSSFTADQWAAIQSGITAAGVAKLNGIETGAEVNKINSVSVNGTAVTPDENKNVNIPVPTPPTVVQTTGDSTTDVMSQNTVTIALGAKENTGTSETLIISSWSALSGSDPYDYQATVSVTTTIPANGTVELVNDQAVLFATHGFAIDSVDTTNNTVTIYSIGEPTSSVSLNIKVRS